MGVDLIVIWGSQLMGPTSLLSSYIDIYIYVYIVVGQFEAATVERRRTMP